MSASEVFPFRERNAPEIDGRGFDAELLLRGDEGRRVVERGPHHRFDSVHVHTATIVHQ